MNRWKISRDMLELSKTVSEIKMSLDGINNRINSKKKSNEHRKIIKQTPPTMLRTCGTISNAVKQTSLECREERRTEKEGEAEEVLQRQQPDASKAD